MVSGGLIKKGEKKKKKVEDDESEGRKTLWRIIALIKEPVVGEVSRSRWNRCQSRSI